MGAIIARSWILTIYKDRIFQKNLLENKEMDLYLSEFWFLHIEKIVKSNPFHKLHIFSIFFKGVASSLEWRDYFS